MTSTCDNAPFALVRGASFVVPVRIPTRFADGYFAGWEIESQVITAKGAAVATLQAAWQDPATTRVLTLTCMDTSAWPIGQALFDVRLRRTSDGYVLATEAQGIYVVPGATPHA